jgi:hypothetical protein
VVTKIVDRCQDAVTPAGVGCKTEELLHERERWHKEITQRQHTIAQARRQPRLVRLLPGASSPGWIGGEGAELLQFPEPIP